MTKDLPKLYARFKRDLDEGENIFSIIPLYISDEEGKLDDMGLQSLANWCLLNCELYDKTALTIVAACIILRCDPRQTPSLILALAVSEFCWYFATHCEEAGEECFSLDCHSYLEDAINFIPNLLPAYQSVYHKNLEFIAKEEVK